MAVIFFYHNLLLLVAFTFKSETLYAARTFLLPSFKGKRQNQDSVFPIAKIRNISGFRFSNRYKNEQIHQFIYYNTLI